MLLQGLNLSSISLAASGSLPTARTLPTEPPPPLQDPHTSLNVEDTSGQARVRGATTTASSSSGHGPSTCAGIISAPPPPMTPGPSTSASPDVSSEVDVQTRKVSRTTELRNKNTGKSEQRKTYTCKTCSQPMTSAGHTQFRGQRYCPNAPGRIPKEQAKAKLVLLSTGFGFISYSRLYYFVSSMSFVLYS